MNEDAEQRIVAMAGTHIHDRVTFVWRARINKPDKTDPAYEASRELGVMYNPILPGRTSVEEKILSYLAAGNKGKKMLNYHNNMTHDDLDRLITAAFHRGIEIFSAQRREEDALFLRAENQDWFKENAPEITKHILEWLEIMTQPLARGRIPMSWHHFDKEVAIAGGRFLPCSVSLVGNNWNIEESGIVVLAAFDAEEKAAILIHDIDDLRRVRDMFSEFIIEFEKDEEKRK